MTDLQAAEFEVKSEQKLQVVARAGTSTDTIAVVVSDAALAASGRAGEFHPKLSGRAELALVSSVVQPEIGVDYTSDSSV